MSVRNEDPRTQSKVNQSAVKNFEAGGNITIGDILQQVVQIFLPWSQTGLSKTKKEKRSRETLLTRVRNFWLSEQSSEEKIELRLQDRYDCDAEDVGISLVVKTVANIFDGWRQGQSLLILGEPGVGKTTTLLQLAQEFFDRAEKDVLSHQLPVVFDLSSWGNERQPIANWLVKELKTKYRIDESWGKTWVKNEQMILFLDGLNEVNNEHRSACVQAINRFMKSYGNTEVIVCSRIEEYKNLDERLTIQHTVLVQPLTSEQISQYLERCGEQLNNLRALLQEDAVVRNLAKTPLMLYVMRIAHENLPITGLLEERRSHIFNTYINENFKRERDKKKKKARNKGRKYKQEEEKYQEKDVRIWLRWLANKMSKMSKTVFLIEEMQPSWLEEEEKKAYRKITTWRHGIFFGFLFGTAYGAILHCYLFYLYPGKTNSTLQGGVFFGTIIGIIVGTAATFFFKVYELNIETYGKVEFSWGDYLKNIFKNTYAGIAIGLSVFLNCWAIMPTIFRYTLDETMYTGLIAGVFFGILTAISRATGDSFLDNSSNSKDIPVRPNQGIWDSLTHALATAIISAVSIGIIYTLTIIIIGETDLMMLILGLCFAVLSGFYTSILNRSGRNCELHFTLRIVLKRNNRIPHDYADFLDYATQLTFMKRIGGGYKFYHELLQDHFKKMDG